MSYKQESLYNIFQREKQRFADEPINISYNVKSNTIQYKDRENNVMTVKLNPEEGKDLIFYRQFDAPKGSHFGDEVAVINVNTNYYGDDIRFFKKMSDGFQTIADDWFMKRDEIGVEKTDNPLPVKKFDTHSLTKYMSEEYRKTYDLWQSHHDYKPKAKTLQEMMGKE